MGVRGFMKNIDIYILSLFPELFLPFFQKGVMRRAYELKDFSNIFIDNHVRSPSVKNQNVDRITVSILNPRAVSPHFHIDHKPYGGSPGMVIRADRLEQAINEMILKPLGISLSEIHQHFDVLYPSPRGKIWDDHSARTLAKDWMTYKNSACPNRIGKKTLFISGRYEGIDERFLNRYVTRYDSIGPYVLSGGELAILSILDSTCRFLPGVLNNEKSFLEDSYSGLNNSTQHEDELKEISIDNGMLKEPQYTYPLEFHDEKVPEILLSGHHQKIKDYRSQEALKLTKKYRPDLLNKIKKN
jgi:tRNA (guanine37-N1)-methyltransferase